MTGLSSVAVKAAARRLGFDACGIAPAGDLSRARSSSPNGWRGATVARWPISSAQPTGAPMCGRVMPAARSVIVTATVYNTNRPYSTEQADPGQARDRALRVGRRLSRRDRGTSGSARPMDARGVARALRRAHVCRHRSGAGACLRPTRGHRVDWQEHVRDQSGARIVDLSRRDSLQSSARFRRAVARSMRHLHALPRSVSHASHRRAGAARLDTLHLVPHDRAPRRAAVRDA